MNFVRPIRTDIIIEFPHVAGSPSRRQYHKTGISKHRNFVIILDIRLSLKHNISMNRLSRQQRVQVKLVPAFTIGARNSAVAWEFVADLSKRLAHRVQLTTDGNTMYINAMDNAFAGQVDYAMLVKKYGETDEGESSRRYSPRNLHRV